MIFDDEVEIALNKRYIVKHLLSPARSALSTDLRRSGKTFVGLDLAAHIAHGMTWAERATEQAPVLYCALEGGAGIDRRIKAIVSDMGGSDGRLARYDGHLTLGMDGADRLGEQALIQAGQKIEATTGEPVGLILIDTLWCAMGGADENSAKDMGVVIARLKRIAEATGAAMLVIHHPGKDEAKGMRGSSSLFAACDCVLQRFRGQKSTAGMDREIQGRSRWSLYLLMISNRCRLVWMPKVKRSRAAS